MGIHMNAETKALCYFYRNPPKNSGVKPQPYSKIPGLIGGKRRLQAHNVKWAVKDFHMDKQQRGRKTGWRKTSAAEDAMVLAAFQKVRSPLGSSVVTRDVWNALPDRLRRKLCLRTVRERLRENGFQMDEKKAADDKGDAWRKRRFTWCQKYQRRSAKQWGNALQAVGDFRIFTWYPRRMKAKHKVKSCSRTIMSQAERNKSIFLKPRHKVFTRTEYKRARKAKAFGLTSSTGQSLVIASPLNPKTGDWVKMVRRRVSDFLEQCFPNRQSFTILLDGETIFHTEEASTAMRELGVRILADWPPHSPDLNPQENVWSWAEQRLRKTELKTDNFATFKRRIIHVCHQYTAKDKLVESMAGRVQRCIELKGANIGK